MQLLLNTKGTQLTCAQATISINTGDYIVLKKLYSSTNGKYWFTPWNITAAESDPSFPCSHWNGIICDSNGRVTSIHLVQANLTGTIPTEVGTLTALNNEFNLNRNKLSGTIPTEVESLVNVITFNLRSNQLSGSIPTQLGALTKLPFLRLDGNHLTGTIPTELGAMINIYYLSLFNNQLTGTLPSELGNLVKLQIFDISDNQLLGSIPFLLCHLQSINQLCVL